MGRNWCGLSHLAACEPDEPSSEGAGGCADGAAGDALPADAAGDVAGDAAGAALPGDAARCGDRAVGAVGGTVCGKAPLSWGRAAPGAPAAAAASGEGGSESGSRPDCVSSTISSAEPRLQGVNGRRCEWTKV